MAKQVYRVRAYWPKNRTSVGEWHPDEKFVELQAMALQGDPHVRDVGIDQKPVSREEHRRLVAATHR